MRNSVMVDSAVNCYLERKRNVWNCMKEHIGCENREAMRV